jgi:hypothetical protein
MAMDKSRTSPFVKTMIIILAVIGAAVLVSGTNSDMNLYDPSSSPHGAEEGPVPY